MEHFMANSLDSQYQQLLQDIIDFGVDKQDRTGTGTKSIFGYTIHHNMSWGFPLLTTKKVPFKTMATELMWFLMGDTNIKYLVDNNCHIWDGDAFANYYRNFEKYLNTLPEGSEVDFIINKDKFINKIKTDDEFAKKWGELGPIYGKQWRRWHTSWDVVEDKSKEAGVRRVEKGIDQIQNLINDLKTNPDSRRLMVSAWNVGELDEMTLPPCHYGFQVYTRELSLEERLDLASKTYDVFDPLDFSIPAKVDHDEIDKLYPVPKRAISLMWNQRSCDVPLGIPMNIASYGLLLMMIADEVNMIPEELIGNLGDCHIYLNQMDGVKEQIGRESYPLPTVHVRDGIHCSSVSDVILENYQSHSKIYFPLSN